ncbi:MAG: efflux RND transporter periplasmic adaptor subunit [Bacteroidetes bacterium]|nr:efflux RND transporter periplasmic adaptor subunit [Bacteroidota bacterium]
MNKILKTIIIFSLISCNDKKKEELINTEVNSIQSSKNIVTLVQVENTKINNFEYFINTNGKISSENENIFYSDVIGLIKYCKIKDNQFVKMHELLFDTQYLFRLKRAQQVKYVAQKEYESRLLGYEELLKGKSIDETEIIKKNLRIASGVESSDLDIVEAEYEFKKSTLRAPFSGVLADVKIKEGQFLRTGLEIFRLYDPNSLQLEVKVLESDISLLKIGMNADISPISNSKESYNAKISVINPYVDENGMVTVKLIIKGINLKKLVLLPGMNCSAKIRVPLNETLTIPKESVLYRNGRSVVFTYEKGKARWNYVKEGRDNGNRIEIINGLKINQLVITNNNLQLIDDAQVKIDSSNDKLKGGLQ